MFIAQTSKGHNEKQSSRATVTLGKISDEDYKPATAKSKVQEKLARKLQSMSDKEIQNELQPENLSDWDSEHFPLKKVGLIS